MPRPTRIVLDVADVDTDYWVDGGTGASLTVLQTTTPDSLAHQLNLTSAANLSALTFTVVGTDADGRALTEAITGPNADTVESAGYFLTITSITPSATLGANTIDIGFVDEVASKTIPLNWRGPKVAYSVDVNGTLNYDVEITNDDFNGDPDTFANQDSMHWQNSDVTDVVNATADAHGVESYTPRGCRLVFNSYSSGADATLTIVQSDD